MNNIKLFTIGVFDLFHYGHLKFLQNCKILSNTITVALASDDHAFHMTQKNIILPYAYRLKTLRQTGLVDFIYETQDDNCYRKLLSSIKPDIFIVGSNWNENDLYNRVKITKQWLDMEKIMLLFNANDPYISSDYIREKCSECK